MVRPSCDTHYSGMMRSINDGYTWSAARFTEQYTRDEFGRSLQVATGNAGSNGTFVHLYINGLYWGLYNPCERPDHSFSADYYGGEKENWDAIHSGHERFEVINGDSSTWDRMLAMCRQAAYSDEAYMELQGNNPDGMPNPAYRDLLDVTNYIDYLIVNLWGGNWDWPWKNWYAARDRSDNSTGFKFYCWDYENTMGNNLGRSPLNKNTLNNNFSSAGEPHQSLKQNAEYRMLFADRVHRFFFNDAVLTPQSLIDRYTSMANEIEMAIATESARWGDQHHSTPLTLDDWYDHGSNYNDGRAGRDWILNYYLPLRSDVVLQQFRNAGLYPNVDAPVFRINGFYKHGGLISKSNPLSMIASSGTIWYTLDGSDPRSPGTSQQQAAVLVSENADKHVLVPTGPTNDNWKGGDDFDDSAWFSCTGSPGGIGF
ncbi:MAG: CotH kinase family protein, partial [Planctomycetota bacterium]